MPGPPFPTAGAYTKCPLCNRGEAGAEHLTAFCPAAHDAWNRLGAPTQRWWLGWQEQGELASPTSRLALRFNHALAFLAVSLGHTPVATATEGVKLVIKQVLQRASPALSLESYLTLELSNEVCDLTDRRNQWTSARDHASAPCLTCGETFVRSIRTWHGRHSDRTASCGPETPSAALITTRPVPDGSCMLSLSTPTTPATWPFGMDGPMGLPISDAEGEHNIEWRCARCPECQNWKLAAWATRDIEVGSLLRGPEPPRTLKLHAARTANYLVAFDGGARHRSPDNQLPEGPRAAGAGAILWGPPDQNGSRACLGQAVIAAPAASSSLVAEALGFRAAIALTLLAVGHPGEVSVVGDNLGILRTAATNGRIRSAEVWQLLEAPITHATAERWACQWVAVRRFRNKTADALATIGTHQAVDLACAGDRDPQVTLWLSDRRRLQSNTRLPWHADWATTIADGPPIEHV